MFRFSRCGTISKKLRDDLSFAAQLLDSGEHVYLDPHY